MQKQMIGNRYRLKGLIGEGGMASVYAALDEKLDRRVAVKILHPHLARNNDIRERFLREARTVSTLDHPNIIKVYDFSGLDSEQLWMVTEILYGVDLAEYVKRYPKNRLHPILAILITREICRALHEAHKLQIVHRDIKPENIMFLDNGLVKLMDFGIAKVHRANATLTGTFMGSPSYMSPEQIRGSDVDVRADIYSLSVLFYEIVTGVLPYSGQTTAEVINKIMVGRYTAANLMAPDLPFAINEIIAKGLKGQKEERFQDITEMSRALDEFLKGFGFGESRAELEQYTTDRLAFDERLANLKMPKTSIPKIESHKNILDHSKPASSRSQYTAVAADQAAETKILGAPGASRAPTNPPRSAHLPDNHKATAEPRGRGIKKKRSGRKPEAPGEMSSPLLPVSPRTTGSPQTPAMEESHRSPQKRAIIREVSSDDSHRRSSPTSTYIIVGLIAAIALVFVFGNDKLMNRNRRDSGRVTQQAESVMKNPVVESQTVVIDSNKTQGMSEKTLPGNKTTKPVLTPNKSTNPPPKTRVTALIPGESTSRPKINSQEPSASPIPAGGEARPPLLASVPERSQAPTDRLPPEPPRRGEAGILKISSSLPAEIFIDGKSYSSTNDEAITNKGIRLEPGNHTLRLKRKGFRIEEQQVQIKSGEMKNLNINLVKSIDLVELNIRSNRIPATLVIEDTKGGGRRKEMTLTKHSLTLNLKPGSYRVVVSFEQEVVSRPIDLRENEGSQTFNAEFK